MPATNNIATNSSFARFYNAGGKGYMHAGEPKSAYSWHTTSTVRYYAPASEREISNGQTTDYTYIESPNGLIAAVKIAGNKQDVMLLATDHLGSIIGVWNASGTLLEEHRYSAWGLRTSSTASPRLRRGLTGHEHLQQFGIIDMQARLYDPHLGRFLAPDPYVQAPDNHLSLNRYAYCINNPLKYTDPDGEWVHILVSAIIGSIQGTIQDIKIAKENGATGWAMVGYGLCGGLIGGAAGALSSWGGGAVASAAINAGKTAIQAAALSGAVAGIISGGINSGGMTALAGGDFSDIMYSAAHGAVIGGACGAVGGFTNQATNDFLCNTYNIGVIKGYTPINTLSYLSGSITSHMTSNIMQGQSPFENFKSVFKDIGILLPLFADYAPRSKEFRLKLLSDEIEQGESKNVKFKKTRWSYSSLQDNGDMNLNTTLIFKENKTASLFKGHLKFKYKSTIRQSVSKTFIPNYRSIIINLYLSK